MQYCLTHSQTKDKVEIDIEQAIIIVNSHEIKELDIRDIELLYLIISACPNVVTYQQIKERILKKYDVATSEYTDYLTYIRKKKTKITKVLSKNYNIPPIIETVRSVGYKLNKFWIKDSSVFLKKRFILLANLIKDVIKLQQKMPLLNQKENDNIYIFLDKENYEKNIKKLQQDFINLAKTLIHSLHFTPYEFRLFKIEYILSEMYSYVSMERVGINIEHHLWRKLFKSELEELLTKLAVLINDNS